MISPIKVKGYLNGEDSHLQKLRSLPAVGILPGPIEKSLLKGRIMPYICHGSGGRTNLLEKFPVFRSLKSVEIGVTVSNY